MQQAQGRRSSKARRWIEPSTTVQTSGAARVRMPAPTEGGGVPCHAVPHCSPTSNKSPGQGQLFERQAEQGRRACVASHAP